jgi:hypothetical protein
VSSENGGGTVTVRNATISGNVGPKRVVNEDQLVFDHVTLVGDGITTTGTTTLGGSILDAGASGTVCDGAVTSAGSNLEHGTSCALAMSGDVSGADPLLGPLQDNGGGTLTHALTAASPAVDAAGAWPSPKTSGQDSALDGNLTRSPRATSARSSWIRRTSQRRAPRRPPRPAGRDDVDHAGRLSERTTFGGALLARRAPGTSVGRHRRQLPHALVTSLGGRRQAPGRRAPRAPARRRRRSSSRSPPRS